jgi:hypothetical protein
MSRRFALVGLSSISVFLALDLAQADQIFPSTSQSGTFTSCRFGDGGVRCTHFEGYVVVRRHEAATAPKGDVKPDAVLSANRLYLRAEDDKTP